MRNQSAMRNWYNCWYIYVTKEPQSHHTWSMSFSIEFIRFALHSHFPRTCRRRSHCRHWRRLFIAQRGRQPDSTHLLSFCRPKNPISIFHNLHPIALGRTRVFNTKHPREGCDASRRHRCRRRVRPGPIRRMMYRCFLYLALDSRCESLMLLRKLRENRISTAPSPIPRTHGDSRRITRRCHASPHAKSPCTRDIVVANYLLPEAAAAL